MGVKKKEQFKPLKKQTWFNENKTGRLKWTAQVKESKRECKMSFSSLVQNNFPLISAVFYTKKY